MTSHHEVIFSQEAAEDLERLIDHILEQELASPSGDLDIAARTIDVIRNAYTLLSNRIGKPRLNAHCAHLPQRAARRLLPLR